MEYVPIDNSARVTRMARLMGETGARGAKHYAEHAEWGETQKRAGGIIDFRRPDAFGSSFEGAGFTDLVICLRSHPSWASK